jgi:iron complex outermembrane receptor protein
VAFALSAASARAQTIAAEPLAPIEPAFPEGAPAIEVQVVLQLVVAADGAVESVVVISREPASSPSSFDEVAVRVAREARFSPSTRDGRPVRSRIESIVVFHPPSRAAATPPGAPPDAPPSRPLDAPPSRPLTTNEQDEDYAQVVEVRGRGWSSPRGLGDVRIKRELLDASPRQQTSEMLSSAPGFFVDHEDGEGLGNDVYLRGFDLEHGSGIEMRLGSIPINIPTHIRGQGYADANFIIPEVVRSIRVLGGPYDPRQGDAAIVGSAYFDLGVPERGYELKSTYGSFGQARLLGIVAPEDADEETFAAFAVRSTRGFGQSRAAQSAALNAQYAIDLGPRDRARFVATAQGSRALLPGVVREDDVAAGRIGYYDAYPLFAQGQSVQSSRVIVGADFDHVAPRGARFEFAPWLMWTDFRSRQNFTGDLESSQIDPSLSGLGDLFELINVETAGGVTTRFHSAPIRLGQTLEVTVEPGATLRVGHTSQAKNLLDPRDLQPWDKRIGVGLDTLDAGAYVDLDLRVFKRLRVSGGPRVDLLSVGIDDHLANVVPAGIATEQPAALAGAARHAFGIAVGPRVTVAYEMASELSVVASYGEGFRSLGASSLREGDAPFSRIRSAEAGLRAQTLSQRFSSSLAVFETWVGNELVFEAAAGGLETESASTRRGVVGSVLAKPVDWLLASAALSVVDATFSTLVVGVGHYVPNVPPVLFRLDATARGTLGVVHGKPLSGRVGVGYTFLSGRHLTDTTVGPTSHVLNARASLRYLGVELGVDAYNVLGLTYADDAQVYVSNWGFRPGQQPASVATHVTAAPPRTVLGSLAIYF